MNSNEREFVKLLEKLDNRFIPYHNKSSIIRKRKLTSNRRIKISKKLKNKFIK